MLDLGQFNSGQSRLFRVRPMADLGQFELGQFDLGQFESGQLDSGQLWVAQKFCTTQGP